MTRYRVTVTAQLASPQALDAGRVRAATGGSVKLLCSDTIRFVATRNGRNAECAVDRALIDLNRALAPGARFAREPVWSARALGWRGLRRATTGRWHIDGGTDDGLGGVREPRRPLPPHGSAAAARDIPAA